MANIAKEIKLTKDGIQLYPQTITQAIADMRSGMRLSDLLSEMSSEIKGLTLVKDTNYRYHLEDKDGNQIGDSIEVPKSSAFSDVSYNPETGNLIFVFESGESQNVDISSLVSEIEVDNETIEFSEGTLSIKEGVFLKKEETLDLLMKMNETLESINLRLSDQETAQGFDEWVEI